MREKLEKLWTFVNNNRLLSFLVILAIILMLPLLFRDNTTTTNTTTKIVGIDGVYSTLVSNPSFEYFKYNGKYVVLVKDSTTQDKEKIRQYLKIPNDIDFEVVFDKNLESISRVDQYESP